MRPHRSRVVPDLWPGKPGEMRNCLNSQGFLLSPNPPEEAERGTGPALLPVLPVPCWFFIFPSQFSHSDGAEGSWGGAIQSKHIQSGVLDELGISKFQGDLSCIPRQWSSNLGGHSSFQNHGIIQGWKTAQGRRELSQGQVG